jgi:hypothetical protein
VSYGLSYYRVRKLFSQRLCLNLVLRYVRHPLKSWVDSRVGEARSEIFKRIQRPLAETISVNKLVCAAGGPYRVLGAAQVTSAFKRGSSDIRDWSLNI